MQKRSVFIAAIALVVVPICAFAIDGQVLINQSTVTAAGGFPYTITQSGSYKLSRNLTVSAPGVDAIDITADNVTLDLNGFTISGPGNLAVLSDGIFSQNFNITLKNGTVTGFQNGVTVRGGGVVSDLSATHNATGISVGLAVVLRCNASFNTSSGFVLIDVALYDSSATSNGNDGVLASRSTVIHHIVDVSGNVGLFVTDSVYGSNTVLNSGSVDVSAGPGAQSQNNNHCTAGAC